MHCSQMTKIILVVQSLLIEIRGAVIKNTPFRLPFSAVLLFYKVLKGLDALFMTDALIFKGSVTNDYRMHRLFTYCN